MELILARSLSNNVNGHEGIRMTNCVGGWLFSRGNCYISLGEYEKALEDFKDSAAVFTKIRNINGCVQQPNLLVCNHA